MARSDSIVSTFPESNHLFIQRNQISFQYFVLITPENKYRLWWKLHCITSQRNKRHTHTPEIYISFGWRLIHFCCASSPLYIYYRLARSLYTCCLARPAATTNELLRRRWPWKTYRDYCRTRREIQYRRREKEKSHAPLFLNVLGGSERKKLEVFLSPLNLFIQVAETFF